MIRRAESGSRETPSGLEMSLSVSHIKNTLGKLFRSRRLATPLWTFNQNSALASQFIGQHSISYSPSIIFHNAKLYHFS
jgi:hypothetical protein